MTASSDEEDLIGQADCGQISVREALGADVSILNQLVDRAFGLITAGRVLQGESLLFVLSCVLNLSYTLAFAVGSCRRVRRDWFGAIDSFTKAIARAENAGAPGSFIQQARWARARVLIAIGAIDEATVEMRRVSTGADETFKRQASAWLSAHSKGDVT
jgi:hypothetical protein